MERRADEIMADDGSEQRALERQRGGGGDIRKMNGAFFHLPDHDAATIHRIGQCAAERQQDECIRANFADNVHGCEMPHHSSL